MTNLTQKELNQIALSIWAAVEYGHGAAAIAQNCKVLIAAHEEAKETDKCSK